MKALAIGPGRPASVVLDVADIGEALVQIEVNGRTWIADDANALDVIHGAPASDVDDAIEIAGWRVEPIARSLDGTWTIHELACFDAEHGPCRPGCPLHDDVVGAALAELERGGDIEEFTGPDGETRYRLVDRQPDPVHDLGAFRGGTRIDANVMNFAVVPLGRDDDT